MSQNWPETYLFSNYNGFDIHREWMARMQSEIANLPAERVLNTDIDELVEYYVASNHVEVPRLLMAELTAEHREKNIEVVDRCTTPRVAACRCWSSPAYDLD